MGQGTLGDRLYFQACGLNGIESCSRSLWTTDGTIEGTKDLAPSFSQYYPEGFMAFNNKMFFSSFSNPDGSGTQDLNSIDADGTTVETFVPGAFLESYKIIGTTAYISLGYPALKFIVTDGTVGGTQDILGTPPVSDALNDALYHDGKLFFSGGAVGLGNGDTWLGQNTEPYVIDGLNAYLLKEIRPGLDIHDGSTPFSFTELNGKVYFAAAEEFDQFRLWVTDGTEAGTQKVTDKVRLIGTERWVDQHRRLSFLAKTNGVLVFTGDDGANGVELWRSDGTEEGTYMLKDLAPGEAVEN